MATNPHPHGTNSNRSTPDAGTLPLTRNVPRSPAGCTTDPCTPALPTLGRIFVVKKSMTKMDGSIINNACEIVKSELASVFKDNKKKLTGIFTVTQGEPDGTAPKGAKDFSLYLLRKSDSAEARLILQRYFPDTSPAGVEKAFKGVLAQMNTEGGAAAHIGTVRYVAFVALDLFEEEASDAPESENESADRKTRVSIYLAGMMLHELGHCMGASHDTGIMARNEKIETMGVPDRPHFSLKSKHEILAAFAPQRKR